MNSFDELDPQLLVDAINQLDNIAFLHPQLTDDVKSFKLKATTVSEMAQEVKDLLGRSEYNAIRVHQVITYPDRVAGDDDTWINADGLILNYAPGVLLKGSTIIRAVLTFI